ncbi:MAG: oligosaccharide flippase family protein [Syntrophobacterales bacterium]|jgi:O-antigen/teichoic acid export membrane protein
MISTLIDRFVESSTFKKHVTSTFLTQVGKITLSVATAAIVAHHLGPEGKGMLALALLVPGILGLFLSGGINVANVYFTGSRRLDVPTLAANSVGFALVMTILGFGAVICLASAGWLEAVVPGVPVWIVLLAMLAFPIILLNGFFSSILQGLQLIFTVNLISFIQSILTLSLTLLLVIGWKLGLLGALLASLASWGLSLIVWCITLRRHGGVLTPRWSYDVLRSTLSFGLRGYIGNVLQFFNYRLDMFILNYFLGPASVGIYAVSVRLAELLWYLPNAVGFVIFPRAAASKPEEMNVFTPRVFRATLGLTALGALGLAFVGRPVINLVFSSAFVGAFIPMLVLLPGVVLLGGAKVLTNELAGRGYPHYNSLNAGLALILTVVLDLVLIPRYGVVGAALASSAAYTTIFFTATGFYLTVSRATKDKSPMEVSAS